MSSWGYLIKRIIHTVITLLIVLVLLFVIFRLMPGDPTKFQIEPGMDPDAFHLIAVRYGFEKEILSPGNIYDTNVDVGIAGAYGMQVNATDSSDKKSIYYGVYNKPGLFIIDANTTVTNISISQQPSLNENTDVNLELTCTTTCPSQFDVNITHEGTVVESLSLPKGATQTVGTGELAEYSGPTSTISEYGNFFVSFEAFDENAIEIQNVYGFSVNMNQADLAPFTINELQIIEIPLVAPEASVAITSSTNVGEVNLDLISPRDTITSHMMRRGTEFVPVPTWEQFIIYMKNMLSFDFGESFVSGRPVWSELSQRIPPTLLLFGTALILSAILGVLIGAIMAWRRGSKLEISGIVVGLFFYSMPIFWFGLILLALFSFHLEWFPLRGMLTPGASYQGLDYVADLLWHLTLPLITLTMGSLAGWLLLMRNSMLEVMGEDYITTAKAKGLSERKVMYKHAARIFLLAIMTILANMLADLLYSYLDPRVRLAR
jgi:peptide/nickel transport system permease protein